MFMDTDNRTTPISWPSLQADELLQWEGRPAPRCYTFRQWRHALFGLVLTATCGFWMVLGVQQAAEQGWPWLAWIPLPFLGYALWLACGQLVAARLEWDRVAYAITDQRLLLRRGLWRMREVSLPLERITWFRLQPHGEELGTLQVRGGEGDPVLIMHCIEYPRRPAELLEKAIKAK
ncbi:MAG: hypothetical protein FIB02_04430 [Desulfuromonas sp.]|nr:hypothetical protein [Desulfuromonas sp.]